MPTIGAECSALYHSCMSRFVLHHSLGQRECQGLSGRGRRGGQYLRWSSNFSSSNYITRGKFPFKKLLQYFTFVEIALFEAAAKLPLLALKG